MAWTLEDKRRSGREYMRRKRAEIKAARTPEQVAAEEEKKRLAQIPWHVRNKARHNLSNRLNFLKKVSWFYAFKKTLKCLRCGEEDYRTIDFHHRNPEEKEFEISYLTRTHNWKDKELVLRELAKCDPICANCHKKEHHSDQNPQKFSIRLEYYVNQNQTVAPG